MASNMKAVKLRIKSVQSTMQITKAMELVASSKLRKAKERAETCRPYFTELHDTLKDIARENWQADITQTFLNVWNQQQKVRIIWFCRLAKRQLSISGSGALNA